MDKEHAHFNGGDCNKLATCSLFIFHYESGLVLKTVFDKKKLVRISPVFSSFFPIPHPRPSPFSLRVQASETALSYASYFSHTAIVKLLQ